jgi:hypothetical protein
LTDRSLFCADPAVDVKPRDRIRVGGTEEGGGVEYFVNVRPGASPNPFTGSELGIEIPLDGTEG